MVQLPIGSNCPFFSKPVYVLQICVCKTSPPGVGEQHVFSMTVVFSHENVDGWEEQLKRLGIVLGSCATRESGAQRAGEVSRRTTGARRLNMAISWRRPHAHGLYIGNKMSPVGPIRTNVLIVKDPRGR